jgi:hypothetical protein
MMESRAHDFDAGPQKSQNSEAEFIKATVQGSELSLSSIEASTAFSRLLWALGGSSSEEVAEAAHRWVETIEESGRADAAICPQQLVETIMSGAHACMMA